MSCARRMGSKFLQFCDERFETGPAYTIQELLRLFLSGCAVIYRFIGSQ